MQTCEDNKKPSTAVSTRPSSAGTAASRAASSRCAPGQVPEYILRRKEEQRQRALEEERERARRALVPDGFRLVPPGERVAAERALRELWQETMRLFLRIPHDTVSPSQVQRRKELEDTIQLLESRLSFLSVEDGAAVIMPEGVSLVPAGLGQRDKPSLSEGQRIKILQSGPAVI